MDIPASEERCLAKLLDSDLQDGAAHGRDEVHLEIREVSLLYHTPFLPTANFPAQTCTLIPASTISWTRPAPQ